MIGSIVHEIGHALGNWHEQSRLDRAENVYVDVSKQNNDNYAVGVNTKTLGIPYDFGSVLHYSRAVCTFSFSYDLVPSALKVIIKLIFFAMHEKSAEIYNTLSSVRN